jgi:hypothetical protein
MTEPTTNIQAPYSQTSASTPQKITLKHNVDSTIAAQPSGASSTITTTIATSVMGSPEASTLVVKPCTVTFSTTEELATKLQQNCKHNAITLTKQVDDKSEFEGQLKAWGEHVKTGLPVIVVVVAVFLFWLARLSKIRIDSPSYKGARKSSSIFNTTPGILLSLLGLTVTSIVLGIALIAWYKELDISNDFGQGSGSLIQAIWGSAATIAAAVVAIVLALRSQQLSEATHDLEQKSQLRELERYTQEVKVQLRQVTKTSQMAFAEMNSRDTHQLGDVTLFFAAMMLVRIDEWYPVEDEDKRNSLDPHIENSNKGVELINIYQRLRNVRHASEGRDINELAIDRVIKRFVRKENPECDGTTLDGLFHDVRNKCLARNLEATDQEMWPHEIRFYKDCEFQLRYLVEGDIDKVTRSTYPLLSNQEVRNNAKISLIVNYAESAKLMSHITKFHENFREICNYFCAALKDLESNSHVMDLVSEGASYQPLFNVRKHINKLNNLLGASKSKGKTTGDYYKWIMIRYSLAQSIQVFILNNDLSAQDTYRKAMQLNSIDEHSKYGEIGLYFWLIFLALPIDDQDFTVRNGFSFIQDLHHGLIPFTQNRESLFRFFGIEDLSMPPNTMVDDKNSNPKFRYEPAKDFVATVGLLGEIDGQIKNMLLKNKGLIYDDIDLIERGSWRFWHAVFRSALYPPEAAYCKRAQASKGKGYT